MLIPATHALEHLPGEEHRVAAQRGHAQVRMVVQPALEPEEVFEHVEGRVPLGLVVHELHPALEHRHILFQHDRVDHVEDVRVDVVFGIENGHYLVARGAQAHIETMGLVDGLVLEGDHAHVVDALAMQLRDLLLGFGDGPGIVDRADHYHLQ